VCVGGWGLRGGILRGRARSQAERGEGGLIEVQSKVGRHAKIKDDTSETKSNQHHPTPPTNQPHQPTPPLAGQGLRQGVLGALPRAQRLGEGDQEHRARGAEDPEAGGHHGGAQGQDRALQEPLAGPQGARAWGVCGGGVRARCSRVLGVGGWGACAV